LFKTFSDGRVNNTGLLHIVTKTYLGFGPEHLWSFVFLWLFHESFLSGFVESVMQGIQTRSERLCGKEMA
jgi:hypothetical protein